MLTDELQIKELSEQVKHEYKVVMIPGTTKEKYEAETPRIVQFFCPYTPLMAHTHYLILPKPVRVTMDMAHLIEFFQGATPEDSSNAYLDSLMEAV